MKLVATALDQLALFLIQLGNITGDFTKILIGVICGGFAYYAISFTMLKHGLGKGNGIWNICSTLAGLVVGCFYFGEPFTIRQTTGIILACIAFALID